MGRSGCGKGTQSKLMEEYIGKTDAEVRSLFYLETGPEFRHFIRNEGYSNSLALKVAQNAERQPDFLAIWVWANVLVDHLKENMHLLVDGTPRSLPEAQALHTAMLFYGRPKPLIVYLNVSRAWSEKHLKARGREDDRKDEDIKRRLDWFESDVLPAIDYFRNNPYYHFVEINGEQAVDGVHRDILTLCGFTQD